MGRRWLTSKGNSILKSNLPIGVQNMTLKSIGEKNVENYKAVISFLAEMWKKQCSHRNPQYKEDERLEEGNLTCIKGEFCHLPVPSFHFIQSS